MSEVPTELLRALAHLAEPPGAAHAPIAAALELPAPPDAAGYEALFGFQLYPWASVYVSPEGMMGGEAQRRVEGFWRAVGRDAPAEPDHLASLAGLYVALVEEESEAREDGGAPARAELIARSRRALLEEHVVPWAFPFLERVEELGGAFHRAWAKLLHGLLEAEVRRHGAAEVQPAYLERLPDLPDPRGEGEGEGVKPEHTSGTGARDFVAGLLAPGVSGVILTRADLAGIARARDLGLRAGERRYALEHLLAQEPGAVLTSLAAEAQRQAEAHERRAATLGPAAGWAAQRAHRTTSLLRALAETADEVAATAATTTGRDS